MPTVWTERPPELGALLNPAFGALLLNAASIGHVKEVQAGMPFLAAFLVLPTILHKDTRVLLPRTIRTKMHAWVAEHGEIRAGFAQRAKSMVPYTREAVAFGTKRGILTFDKNGSLYGRKVSTQKVDWTNEDEPSLCLKKAEFLGRWLAHSTDLSGLFAMWGIRP